jgi:DNA polymerase
VQTLREIRARESNISMIKLTLDFETRSTIDLLKCGPWKYAAHSTTDVFCLAVKVNAESSRLWLPDWVSDLLSIKTIQQLTGLRGQGLGVSRQLKVLIDSADVIEAHNVEFERAIWHHIMHRRYGFPDLDLNKCDCTAARAAAQALPRALKDVCQALRLPIKKDLDGRKLMLKMCKPRHPRKAERTADPQWASKLFWHETPEEIKRLCEYCIQDVETEYALSGVLRPLSSKERQVWLLDQKINQRGLCVDVDSIDSIMMALDEHELKLLNEIWMLTGGRVESPRQVANFRRWMEAQGVSTENLQKGTVLELLGRELPGNVRRALEIRQALGKSSVSKLEAMLCRAQEDNRCRSLFMYHGASTGRWSGKGIQPQNLPRDSYKDDSYENVINLYRRKQLNLLEILYDDPFFVASRCVRGSVIASPGHDLICADYSAIEARGLAWLAGEESVLQAFRQKLDLYKVAAEGTFGIGYDDIDADQRQVGKVQVLALGYQGGIGAFASMAVTYGIDLETLPRIVLPLATSEELDGPYGAKALALAYLKRSDTDMSFNAAVACDILKRKRRASTPNTVALWKSTEEAALAAVRNPGETFSTCAGVDYCPQVLYRTWRDAGRNNFLLAKLPSGRVLFYADPEIRATKTPWGSTKNLVTYMTVDSVTRQWRRERAFGGLFCENNTQAICRDLLAEAMLRLEAKGYPIVIHVHDEPGAEVPEDFGSLEEFEAIMAEVPPWAEGMPIDVEGWRGKRFRK